MLPLHRGGAQDPRSVEKNKSFFAANQKYAADIAGLDTYRSIRDAVDDAITPVRRLLDIGNGGVFDYDTSLVEEIVGVDLFVDPAVAAALPTNVTLRHGNALSLDERSASYDGVLCMLVLHHLVAIDVDSTVENIRAAVGEARRVLEPGGKLVVVESCVSTRAFAVERRLFGLLRSLSGTPLMKHPPTLQFPSKLIADLLRERFGSVRVEPIPVGRFILQFGHRWPTALTPARPFLFTAS